MKKILTLLLTAILLTSCNRNSTYLSEVENKTYYIDFPEEIELISDNKSKPDSLVCYISNDSLIFRFVISEKRKYANIK